MGCHSIGSKKDKQWAGGEEDGRNLVKRALELGINSL